jgi:hypothetical protein
MVHLIRLGVSSEDALDVWEQRLTRHGHPVTSGSG